MTSESKSNTEPWIEDKGVEYAYAYDTEGVLSDALGIRGIPHAVLVDPYGQIVWRGHPMTLEASMVEPYLESALDTPMWNWPDSAAKLRESIASGRLGAAMGMTADMDLSAIGAGVPDMLRQLVDGKVSGLADAIDDHDVRGAEGSMKSVMLAVEGLPEAEKVKALVDRIKTDENLAAARKTFARLDAIEEGLPTTRDEALAMDVADLTGWLDELAELSEQHGDKAPGRAASGLASNIEGLKGFIERERAKEADADGEGSR